MDNNIKEVIKEFNEWYFQDWFIAVLSASICVIGVLTGIAFVTLIVPIVLILQKHKLQKQIQNYAERVAHLDTLNKQIKEKDSIIEKIRQDAHVKVDAEVTKRIKDVDTEVIERMQEVRQLQEKIIRNRAEIKETSDELMKLSKQFKTQQGKIVLLKNLYTGLEYALKREELLPANLEKEFVELCPTVSLHIHSMDVKELRKELKENEKSIQTLFKKYQSNYTTKPNQTIYDLMVLALSAEFQNILYNLKYSNLVESKELILDLAEKYRVVVTEGNQGIAPTMNRFISELEYFYLNAIQIEYKYYAAKEKQKNEQAALREQMRQENEERKQLEVQRKLIEREESKYLVEIKKAQEQLKIEDSQSEMTKQLLDKISQLESQLQEVESKKEEVINRQNGKAGYVYIISNLGSFGDDVFKIGMTRRLDPMDRIKELGSASVPFQFDVHSFIFSDDAVGLEQKLHEALDDRRVNKMNHRKEFFKVSIDELESMVSEIDPIAEFNRTMVAEEYRQGLAIS